jgi:predicted transcriptional regulator
MFKKPGLLRYLYKGIASMISLPFQLRPDKSENGRRSGIDRARGAGDEQQFSIPETKLGTCDKKGKIEFLTFSKNVLHCLTMSMLTIRLPDELKADLQKFSQEQNKPVSDVVRESIRRYVAIEKFRAIRRKVLPFAEAQGFLTDEDVFKAIS